MPKKQPVYTVIVPASQLSDEALLDYVKRVRGIVQAVGAPVDLEITVITRSKPLAELLNEIQQALPITSIAARKNGNGKHAAKVKPGKMGPRFLRIDSTGEVLSKQAFNKKLKAGEIEGMTDVTDAKGGKWVVIDKMLVEGPRS